ncbi:MAG: phosphoglucosamine mutase [Phycisphaeraceae bacterium]|nr:phosphoglucosamine mutase [Phycisphaeraceae bacterium]
MNDAPLMLSVSGLRGLIGRSLTPPVAARYAAAFGQWLKSRQPAGASAAPHVVLGRDSRPSGQMIELAAASGLIAVGCRVTTLGIVTTPGVAIMAEHLGADGGMVITASHNPIIWNGIKALRSDGVAPPPEQANDIIARFQHDDVQYAPVESLTTLAHDDSTHRVHIDRILRHIDVEAIRRRTPRLRVVLDSVHGAGGTATAMMLEALGVELVHLYAQPTGRFPHNPEPTRENLVGLSDAVRQHRGDIGLAQDPDADRLAVVDEQGRYIGEEYTLALATMHLLSRQPQQGKRTVAANLSTSRMIDDIAAAAGATVLRTPVGEANVAAAMRRHGSLIGGEGNGGVIWPQVIHVRDSLVGIALLLELLARRGEPLSRIVSTIPRYAIVKEKLDIQPGMTEKLVPLLRRRWPDEKIDTQDGVRIDWPSPAPGMWVHVRPSNTEPILRIIAEAPAESAARDVIAQVRAALGLQ